MWRVSPEFRWDPSRSHASISRVQVWSRGAQVGESTDIVDGTVTEFRKTGVRASLSLSVPATKSWSDWLELPALELRPFAGTSWGRSQFECPMGVFPTLPPQKSLPRKPVIQVSADDRWQIVANNAMRYPWMGPSDWATALAARLMREAGLGEVSIQVPEGVDTVSPALMWDKTRHDLIVGYLDPIGCESFVDRTGQAIIQDRVTDPGLPLRDGDNATVVDVTSTKDWSAVINVVSAASTNTNVVLDPVIVSISDPEHPAHWSKFGATPEAGARVLRYTSQLIENYGDAFNAATAQLAKLSAPALSWTVTCIADPTRMPGDLVTVTTDLGAIQATVEQVAHPLGAGEQKVTLGAVL